MSINKLILPLDNETIILSFLSSLSHWTESGQPSRGTCEENNISKHKNIPLRRCQANVNLAFSSSVHEDVWIAHFGFRRSLSRSYFDCKRQGKGTRRYGRLAWRWLLSMLYELEVSEPPPILNLRNKAVSIPISTTNGKAINHTPSPGIRFAILEQIDPSWQPQDLESCNKHLPFYPCTVQERGRTSTMFHA